jgi:hypothetical protein
MSRSELSVQTVRAAEITIRRATEADVPAVLRFLALMLGQGSDVRARHEWLYRSNPDGVAVTWLAVDAATRSPVGLTSLFPRRVLVHGRLRRGAIGGDAFVLPEFRRCGIVTALHRHCMSEMRGAGVELMYGPPEPHNLRALVRVGSQIVSRVRRYVRILNPRSWGPIGSRMAVLLRPRSSRATIEPISGTDPRVLSLWERARRDLPISPVRDAAFYAWRFEPCPSGAQRPFLVMDGGRAIAACALERNGARSLIVDFVAPREAWSASIGAILHALRDDEVVQIKLNEKGPLAGELTRHGFIPREAKPFQVLAASDDWQASLLYRASSWFYTTGDGDVDRVLT